MNYIDALDAIPRVQIRNVRGWREGESDESDQQMDECDWRRTGTHFGCSAGIVGLAAGSVSGIAPRARREYARGKLGRSENFYCVDGNQARSGGNPCASTFAETFRPISRPASASIG